MGIIGALGNQNLALVLSKISDMPLYYNKYLCLLYTIWTCYGHYLGIKEDGMYVPLYYITIYIYIYSYLLYAVLSYVCYWEGGQTLLV